MEALKQCKDKECLQWYPATEENFFKQKKNSKKKGVYYDLTSYCKGCMKKRSLKYYHKNSIERNVKRRAYYENNKEKENKRVMKWHNENKDNMRENLKRWQNNNKDKLQQIREDRKQRDHKITAEEWQSCKDYFNNECAYCGLHVSEHFIIYAGELKHTDLHKEHVEHDGANDLSNCIPSCKDCNSSKLNKEFDEWYKNNQNYTEERYNKIIKWLNEDFRHYIKIKLNK